MITQPTQRIDEIFFLYFNLGLITLLTLFDTVFSKYNLYGPIYLHDFLLLIGAFLSLVLLPKRFPFKPILAILIIAGGYLVYSFYHYTTGLSIIIRQFGLFGYMGCYYLLNRSNNPDSFEIIKKFLIALSIMSAALQMIYILVCILQGTFDPFDFHNHYWYSHAAIFGMLIFAAYALVYQNNIFLKVLSIASVLIMCWATGHASAQLALLAMVMAFILLHLRSWRKLVPIAFGLMIMGVLVTTAPQFKDKNTDWRLLTWGYLLKELVTENYAVTGKGFGAAYTNHELEEYLYQAISSTAIKERGRPDERYISPSHNSFITIFFAIGILPGLLIFYPYRYAIKLFWQDKQREKQFDYFLLLSLVGATIWVSFNVVLELPHSAGLFWLIYFTFWSYQERPTQSPA